MKETGRIFLKNFIVNMSKKSTVAGKGDTNKSGKKLTQDKSTSSASSGTSLPGPVTLTANGDIQIPIHVKPGAKANCITDVCSDYWSVQISAPPTDDEANTEIVKFFAQLLNLRKSDVELRGGKSRDKVITIVSSTERPTNCSKIYEMLASEIGKIH